MAPEGGKAPEGRKKGPGAPLRHPAPMHDALPPPLDRQGIGRLAAPVPNRFDADVDLNDGP
ncbi:hypothetical protein NUM_28530 [Actinocatenispora comari]|uniref:Uncharacterized protein n=1 Tax=Actinocatenispora comari TaxID=2807577 RepID=A0A8J4AA15_9ACTN|nr:hypothetical protein NUM_28530 [Actinocatenispora comari]